MHITIIYYAYIILYNVFDLHLRKFGEIGNNVLATRFLIGFTQAFLTEFLKKNKQ